MSASNCEMENFKQYRRKSKMKKLAILTLCLLTSVSLSAIETEHYTDDATINALINETAFVAEARIGCTTTFELDLGPDTGAPAQSSNYSWSSGQEEPFVLTYDQPNNKVTFSLGGITLTHNPDPGITITDIFFARTFANPDGSMVELYDLVLDGENINDSAIAVGPGGLDIMQVKGAAISDGFNLTGKSKMTWIGEKPTQSNMAWQIKVGNIVPEPASLLIFAAGSFFFRKKAAGR